jgi:phosphatidate cytidylyltransferase
MAFNWQTFRTRALTALVFVAVMACGLLVSTWTFFLLFSMVHFGCWIEFQKLVGRFVPDYAGITPLHRYGVILAGWGMLMYATQGSVSLFGISVAAVGFWLCLVSLIALPLAEILFARKLEATNIAWSALGLLYISLSLTLYMHLRSGDLWRPEGGMFDALGGGLAQVSGFLVPLIIIASIWINDTMAYLVGSMIGRTPFSKISPKKTWEGTLGGVILCIVAVTLIGVYALHGEARHYVAISTISAIAGTAGDLLESKLKRVADVKDSGDIMPGHGGFLDRFDSLLLAVPFVWIYAKFFM